MNNHYRAVQLSISTPWYFTLATFLNLTFRPAPFKQNNHIFIHLLMPHILTVALNTHLRQHCLIWLID